jgi:hypothetical protein
MPAPGAVVNGAGALVRGTAGKQDPFSGVVIRYETHFVRTDVRRVVAGREAHLGAAECVR